MRDGIGERGVCVCGGGGGVGVVDSYQDVGGWRLLYHSFFYLFFVFCSLMSCLFFK